MNSRAKEVSLDNGEVMSYDKVLIATGSNARFPSFPGSRLDNIFTIREYDDAVKIREAAKNAKKVVVVGGGFIGVEIASNLKMQYKDAIDVTVVSSSEEPYTHSLGPEVGKAMRILSQDNGVKYRTGRKMVEALGQGNVNRVELDNGDTVDCDLVILGLGSAPNTWFLDKGVHLDQDGGITADVFLKSSTNNDLYAAGDVVSYPYFYNTQRIRVEHISEAISQGAYAAYNMVGKMKPYCGVPFYWTRAFNKSLACVGITTDYDKVIVDGDVTS